MALDWLKNVGREIIEDLGMIVAELDFRDPGYRTLNPVKGLVTGRRTQVKIEDARLVGILETDGYFRSSKCYMPVSSFGSENELRRHLTRRGVSGGVYENIVQPALPQNFQ